MFRIKKLGNSDWFELPANKHIPLRKTNPYFVEDASLQVAFSYPFTLEGSSKILNQLDHPEVPNYVSPNQRIFDVDVVVADCLHLKPKLKVHRSNFMSAEVSIYDEPFINSADFVKTSILDLVGDSYYNFIDTPDVYFDFLIEGTPVAGTFIFIYGQFVTYNIAVLGSETISDIIDQLVIDINSDTITHGLTAENFGSNILRIHDTDMWDDSLRQVTTLFRGKLYYPGATGSGAGLAGGILGEPLPTSWLEDYHDDLNTAMNAICSTSEYNGSSAINFFTTYNDKFYGDINQDFSGFTNMYDPALGKFLLNIDGTTAWSSNKFNVVPFIYVQHIWDLLFETYGINVVMPDLSGFRELMFWNTYSLDKFYISDTSPESSILCFGNRIYYKKHLPDMTISDFLTGLKSIFNFAYDYDGSSKTLTVTQRMHIKDGNKRKDFSNLPFRKNPRFDFFYSDGGIQYSAAQDSGDEYPNGFDAQGYIYTIGLGNKQINLPFSWPVMDTKEQIFTSNPSNIFKLPVTSQQGNSEAYDVYGSFMPRLVFYRGFALEDGGSDYFPYASNDDLSSISLITDDVPIVEYDSALIFSRNYALVWEPWLKYFGSYMEMNVDLQIEATKILNINWTDEFNHSNSNWFIKHWEIIGHSGDQLMINIIFIKTLYHNIV